MTAKYYGILTRQGTARLAEATVTGTTLNLTQMAVGDAGGTLPTPDPAQTTLIRQKRIAPLNRLSIDPNNRNQIIAEQIIPENEGGFWIREIGLCDDDGVLIAVANCPETYKPRLQEGSGRTQTLRMILTVSGTSAITLKTDPAVVLATRQYADDQVTGARAYADDKVTGAKAYADDKIIKAKAYADSLLATHFATTEAHPQYLKMVDIAKFTPVGVPLPFPSATPPAGWLKCNGAPFDKVRYPGLAAVFPSGFLPDLRGEFIRGWDNGRMVDPGRGLLSPQDSENKSHSHPMGSKLVWATPGSSPTDVGAGGGGWQNTGASGGSESRPRNIAFNYIMRAE